MASAVHRRVAFTGVIMWGFVLFARAMLAPNFFVFCLSALDLAEHIVDQAGDEHEAPGWNPTWNMKFGLAFKAINTEHVLFM